MNTTNNTTPKAQDSNNNKGLLSDCQNLIDKHPALNLIFTLITGALAGLGATYQFIDWKVNEVAEQRLAPYEQLLSGLSLNQGEEFSEAAREFQKLVAGKKIDTLPDTSKTLAFDAMLLAIANSDDISEFQGTIKKLKDKMIESGEETPWRLHHLAWALMRSGDLNEAKKYFKKSVAAYKSKREYVASVDPSRGLIFIALFENDVDEAFALGQELKEMRPSQYRSNFDLIAEFKEMQKSRSFDSFNALYEKTLPATTDKYIARLLETAPQEQKEQ
ncbi:hypothetical protein [Pseudomonas sp. 2995-1]|uniref:hypothetical protein n=1 Tax=Pseudomonas sp. 2995-1 TaxID=1712679 RepID=UPI000C152F57|nr:hypothetical protein [Pseudomonas sp. 2995-1]PIB60725.1 hypothetical protein AOA61_01985 [Pseudomonas sp. 2995-1]